MILSSRFFLFQEKKTVQKSKNQLVFIFLWSSGKQEKRTQILFFFLVLQLGLEFDQLLHEPIVRMRDGALLQHKASGLLGAHVFVLHEVRNHEYGRPRDRGTAVHHHFAFSFLDVMDGFGSRLFFFFVFFLGIGKSDLSSLRLFNSPSPPCFLP